MCANFLIMISLHLPIKLRSLYAKKASSVSQLYQLHQVVVFADKLGNVEECSKILCSIMDKNVEKSILDLIEIGALLLLSKEDVVIRLILHFTKKELVDSVADIISYDFQTFNFTLRFVFRSIPSLFDELKRDELVEAIYYGVAYLLRNFSEYNWSILDLDRVSSFVEIIHAVGSFVLKRGKNAVYFSKFSGVLEYTQLIEDTLNICKNVNLSSTNATQATEQQRVTQISEEEE